MSPEPVTISAAMRPMALPGAGGGHHGPAAAADDDGAGRHDVAGLFGVGVRALVDGDGLAGERCLVDEQGGCLDHGRVGGHDVALGQHEQVTDDHLGGWDLGLLRRRGAPGPLGRTATPGR